MPANVEEKALVARRAGNAADIDRVLLQHERRAAVLGKRVARRQARRPRADDDRLDDVAHAGPRGPRAARKRRRSMAEPEWLSSRLNLPGRG